MEKRNFNQYIESKKQKYGSKFNMNDLDKRFIHYYENQKRIEVDFGYEKKRGTVGITTGWKPVFLLILTARSLGSSYILDNNCTIIREV